MSTPFRDAINADSPSFFLPITETTGLTLVDTAGANDGVLSPDSGGVWTGGTMGLPGPSLDAGGKSILTNGTDGLLTVSAIPVFTYGTSLMIVLKRPSGAPDAWTFAKRNTTFSSGSNGYLRITASTRLFTLYFSSATSFVMPPSLDLDDWIVIHLTRENSNSGSAEMRCYFNGVESTTGAIAYGTSNHNFTFLGKGMSAAYTAMQLGAYALFPSELSAARVLAHYEAMTGVPLVPPEIVTGLSGTPNVERTQVHWSWSAPVGADTYQFELDGVAGPPDHIGTSKDVPLVTGTAQTARVRAINADGNGPWSLAVRSGDPIRYWLQLAPEASTGMLINWQRETVDNVATAIEYRAVGSTTWLPASSTVQDHPYRAGVREVRRVTLSGLLPDTSYEWRWSDYGNVRYFKTLPATLAGGGECKMIVAADIYPDLGSLGSKMRERDVDFIAIPGDWAYADGLEFYFSRWDFLWDMLTEKLTMDDGRVVPILPGIGNHETIGGGALDKTSAPYFYTYFWFPPENAGGYAETRAGNWLSLIMLDSAHTAPVYTAGDDQLTWLASRLAANAETLHRIAAWHVPYYPARRSPAAYDYAHDYLEPVLEAAGIRTAFTAHSHCYNRTVRIKAGVQNDLDGVKYFGEGCWGVGIGTLENAAEWYVEAAYDDSTRGRHFNYVTFTEDNLKIEAVGSDGITFYTFNDPVSAPEPSPITGFRLGGTTINKLYLGSTEIKKAYLGSTLIYDKTTP